MMSERKDSHRSSGIVRYLERHQTEAKVLRIALTISPAVVAAIWVVADPKDGWKQVPLLALLQVTFVLQEAASHYGRDAVCDSLRRATVFVQLLAAFAVAAVIGDAKGSIEFYKVSAQLIPVLLLALAFQRSSFSLQSMKSADYILPVLVTIWAVCMGEWYALMAIFRSRPDHASVVAGAIAAVFAGLVMHALAGDGGQARSKSNTGRAAK